jgi:hypothetical protein
MNGRFEDRAMSAAALAITAALGWPISRQVATTKTSPANEIARPPIAQTEPLSDALEARVVVIAEAVAVAEGYYAPGDHDGHSLPYRLNNPGSLKKPALGAALLPTWKDTGLVEFPTAEMGWAALRHQVRGMLTGASRLYELSDTLLLVAEKYADGDRNWGVNVAATLGVSPAATLMDLAPDPR